MVLLFTCDTFVSPCLAVLSPKQMCSSAKFTLNGLFAGGFVGARWSDVIGAGFAWDSNWSLMIGSVVKDTGSILLFYLFLNNSYLLLLSLMPSTSTQCEFWVS